MSLSFCPPHKSILWKLCFIATLGQPKQLQEMPNRNLTKKDRVIPGPHFHRVGATWNSS